MKRNISHPDRNELIAAIKAGEDKFADHLSACDRCRSFWELLTWSGFGPGQVTWEPPDDLVLKHQAVPLVVASRRPARRVHGQLLLDTWSDRPALAVRLAATGVERRLRFEAGRYVVELVANFVESEWEFVARVYDDQAIAKNFVLKVGGRKISAGRGDCFFWNSKRPPRRLSLLSPDLQVDLEDLQW